MFVLHARVAAVGLAVVAAMSGIVGCANGAAADRPSDAAAAAPPPGSPATETGAFSGGGVSTYIEDMEYTSTSDPYDTRETADINGRSHIHSQGAQFCFGDKDRKWEYNLGRRYDRFRATVGLDDNSTTEAVVRYEVVGDGRTLYLQDVRFGESFPIDVSAQNVLRLQLVTTLLSEEGSCGSATAQWGEARAETAS
jgi:hypothetical protein